MFAAIATTIPSFFVIFFGHHAIAFGGEIKVGSFFQRMFVVILIIHKNVSSGGKDKKKAGQLSDRRILTNGGGAPVAKMFHKLCPKQSGWVGGVGQAKSASELFDGVEPFSGHPFVDLLVHGGDAFGAIFVQ